MCPRTCAVQMAVRNKRSLTPFAEAVLAGRIPAAEWLGGRGEGGLEAALHCTYREVPLLHLAAGLGQVGQRAAAGNSSTGKQGSWTVGRGPMCDSLLKRPRCPWLGPVCRNVICLWCQVLLHRWDACCPCPSTQAAAVEWLVRRQSAAAPTGPPPTSFTVADTQLTPLHAAALSGDEATVAVLLDLGESECAGEPRGDTGMEGRRL